MPQDELRVSLQVSRELHDIWGRMASDSGASRAQILLQALALMKVAQDAKRNGKHIGIASDPSVFDQEIIGLL